MRWRSGRSEGTGVPEDVTAEAFARGLAHADTIRDPLAWLYRTAFRLAQDELRKERRSHAPELEDQQAPPEVAGLMQALRELSPNQRAAVVMRFEADLPVSEVAKRMGIAQPTVRVHLTGRARGSVSCSVMRRSTMPERWQREVKKLGTVEPSGDVWRRAEQGPREPPGPSLPPRRQRIVAGVVAIVVFLAAGGFAWRALRPSSDRTVRNNRPVGPTVQVTFKAFKLDATNGPSTFTATMKVGDRTVMGTNTGTGSQFRSRNPFDVPNGRGLLPLAFVPVLRGSLLSVMGDAESVDAELLPPESLHSTPVVSFGQLNRAVALDQPTGRYLLSLTGHWAAGSATLSFPIDLEDKTGTTIGATRGTLGLHFVAGKLAPDVTMRYRADHQDGVRTSYTWCDSSGSCVGGIADFATYPPAVAHLKVPAGTPLLLSGDATAVEGVFRREGHGDQGESYLDEGSIPDTPGRYLLEIHAVFDRGEATFFLGIEVTPRMHW